MSFTDRLFSIFWDISDFFYDAYLEVKDWIWPFSVLQYPLYALYRAFWNLLTPVADLGEWIRFMTGEIERVLTWDELTFWALDIYRALAPVVEWIDDALINVRDIVDGWWSSTKWTVKAWINQAVTGFQTMVNQVEASLGNLRVEWDNFWTLTWPALIQDLGDLREDLGNFLVSILPTLATNSGVGALVDSSVRILFPFYDDLVSLWGDIAGFFTGPLDYLAARLESWFWEES